MKLFRSSVLEVSISRGCFQELEEMIKRKKMSQQARQLIAQVMFMSCVSVSTTEHLALQMEHLIANNNLEEARSLLVRTGLRV